LQSKKQNPELIDFAIPGNDDAIRAITLFLETMANAIIEGTGGEVVQPKFSDDFDEEAMQQNMNYRGEYDEEGRFIEDDDANYVKQFANAEEEKAAIAAAAAAGTTVQAQVKAEAAHQAQIKAEAALKAEEKVEAAIQPEVKVESAIQVETDPSIGV
jgi:small subunit ribosomal protein S2